MTLRRIPWLAIGLCAAVLALCYGGLLVPGRALAARDIPFLHLPLRTTFRALLAQHWGSLPGWDPLIHDGQPLLSNPHYAAFYPGTWALVWLAPIVAIHATILIHAAIAFAGAWRLAAKWGARRAGCALAAVGFAANTTLVSLPGTLLMFTGIAWMPWAFSLADQALCGGQTRKLLTLSAVLALQVLNGDPASVLLTWIGLGALVVFPSEPGGQRWRGVRVALGRLALAVALAVLLGSVQSLPTWARLRDSARGGAGLSAADAGMWSARPVRLLEIFVPRLFGDPARDEEDLFFGARINDKQFPFLQSLYPGMLLAILGTGALLRPPRGGIPKRAALALGAGLGVLFGLGRFNPLFPLLRVTLPFLGMLRYPEKFLILTVVCLGFAGALSFDRLIEPVPDGNTDLAAARPARLSLGAALPLAWALGSLLIAAGLWASLDQARLIGLVSQSALSSLPSANELRAATFLRHQIWLGAGVAAAALGWLVLARRRRIGSARILAGGAILFTLADLSYYGRGLNPTVPASDLLSARPLEREIAASPRHGDRIFSDALLRHDDSTVGFRLGEVGTQQVETLLDSLSTNSAATLGFAYALDTDFDLMLTGWGRHGLDLVRETARRQPAELAPLLSAWNVGTVVRLRPPGEQFREFQQTGGRRPLPAKVEFNPAVLPRWRFVPELSFHATAPDALAAAHGDGFALAEREVLIGEPPATGAPTLDPKAQILAVADGADRVAIRYRAAGPALLVAAMTFDDGWTARAADGTTLPTWPTAIGQLAALVPAGETTVELRYLDPWVRVGAALSLVTLLACVLAASRAGRLPEA
ncbi:MAG: hypothetical protein ABI609_16865 [Acidobacteriota bacterium]